MQCLQSNGKVGVYISCFKLIVSTLELQWTELMFVCHSVHVLSDERCPYEHMSIVSEKYLNV